MLDAFNLVRNDDLKVFHQNSSSDVTADRVKTCLLQDCVADLVKNMFLHDSLMCCGVALSTFIRNVTADRVKTCLLQDYVVRSCKKHVLAGSDLPAVDIFNAHPGFKRNGYSSITLNTVSVDYRLVVKDFHDDNHPSDKQIRNTDKDLRRQYVRNVDL